jgi:transcriptional regulator with XRE-family HTH domain
MGFRDAVMSPRMEAAYGNFFLVDQLSPLHSNCGETNDDLIMTGKPKKRTESDFYRDLGGAIRVARSKAGRSQADTAEYLDVSFQQLQKYESGKNRIPVVHLVKLSDYLEVPLSQLIVSSAEDIEFQALATQFGAREFHALMEAWVCLKDRPARAALVNLVKSMAGLVR